MTPDAAGFAAVRQTSLDLAAPLSAEDCAVQSMPDASPVKWHLAHTTWFFETFVLEPWAEDYRAFHPDFRVLFNSYYNSVGEQHPRPRRGMITRPTLDAVRDYRQFVDEALMRWLASGIPPEQAAVVELGLHHEQQHQELIVTDVKHMLAQNPLCPAYRPGSEPADDSPKPVGWCAFDGGEAWVGHDGTGFAFDNEGPRHRVRLEPFALANRAVSAGEYLEFMGDGGYRRPELWLSEGWSAIQERGWRAPLYWMESEPGSGEWRIQTLAGARAIAPAEPVCHVSYFEADAFATWAGDRLPTEFEWETASREADTPGRFLDDQAFHPGAVVHGGAGLHQMFGDVWEWTRSAYLPYPGYRPTHGALGEYNGKFMVNQHGLRGGSCATPAGHIRATYRNFFPADARWQFSGIRLARDTA